MIDDHVEIGDSDGVTLYAKDNVQYVAIVDAPTDRYALTVKLKEGDECLLDETFSKFDEAVWDALRIASMHSPGEPAVINYRINSCKLKYLTFDYNEQLVLWKDEVAPLDTITNELLTKLKDGIS